VHTLKHVSRRVCFRVNAGCVGVCVNVAYLVGVGVLCQRVLVLLTLCLSRQLSTLISLVSLISLSTLISLVSLKSRLSSVSPGSSRGVGLPGGVLSTGA
jgi:hypothetical protein